MTILITGSTDGIGKLTALKLGNTDHQVLLHGRSKEKLKQTIAEVKSISNNERIVGFIADLSDFASINSMVVEIAKNHSKLDVLINNAGVFNSAIQQNRDHLDMRFAVNYFAPYILTNALLPHLEKSDSPRIINLSSAAQTSVSLGALSGNQPLSAQAAYAQSKLALTMWSFEFAKRHPNINTIAVNPGSLLNTKMVQDAFGRYWDSADKGADILYELALSDKYANSSGQYFDNDKGGFNHAHPDAYQQEKITQLIAETEKILNR